MLGDNKREEKKGNILLEEERHTSSAFSKESCGKRFGLALALADAGELRDAEAELSALLEAGPLFP